MRRRPPAAVLAVAAALALPPAAAARADEIVDQIEQAKRYYGEGDVTGAIEELEFAIQALRGRIGAAYLATFPEPPAGWTVEDAKPEEGGGQAGGAAAAVPFLGGGSVLQRTYKAPEGGGSIQAQLMTGGSFLQGLASMFMNPQVMAAQPNAKRVRIGRENAVVTYDPQERTGQLMLDVAGKVTIMLEGTNLAGADPMVDLANRWDIKRVKEIAGL
jgi:hypothetical protein